MKRGSPGRRNNEAAAAPRLSLSVQYALAAEGLPSRAQLRRWAAAALDTDAQVTLRLVGTREGRRLNREFRGRDYATNVLTFAYPELEPLCGDIVLCVPVIAREAAQQAKSVPAHFAHLVVHGMLHLQGHDHEKAGAARRMESLEKRILMQLGYPDPYLTGSESV
jgi:probable rRNA maturation factor